MLQAEDVDMEEYFRVYQLRPHVRFSSFCLLINNLGSAPFYGLTPYDLRELVRILQRLGICTEMYFNRTPAEVEVLKYELFRNG